MIWFSLMHIKMSYTFVNVWWRVKNNEYFWANSQQQHSYMLYIYQKMAMESLIIGIESTWYIILIHIFINDQCQNKASYECTHQLLVISYLFSDNAFSKIGDVIMVNFAIFKNMLLFIFNWYYHFSLKIYK